MDINTKISNENNASLAVIWASAAGNCLGDAVVMSQQAEHWQFLFHTGIGEMVGIGRSRKELHPLLAQARGEQDGEQRQR